MHQSKKTHTKIILNNKVNIKDRIDWPFYLTKYKMRIYYLKFVCSFKDFKI